MIEFFKLQELINFFILLIIFANIVQISHDDFRWKSMEIARDSGVEVLFFCMTEYEEFTRLTRLTVSISKLIISRVSLRQRSLIGSTGTSNFVEINLRVSIRLILGSTIIDSAVSPGYFITLEFGASISLRHFQFLLASSVTENAIIYNK